MAGFPYGKQVVAGTNGQSADFNNGRKDGLTRFLKFEVVGGIPVANKLGGSYVMPFAGSVVQTYTKCTSGSGLVRINSAANVVETNIAVASTYAVDSSPTLPTIAKGDLFTMDVVSSTSMVDLVVIVEVLPTP